MHGNSNTARMVRPETADNAFASDQYYLECQCYRDFALIRFADVIGFERTFRTPPSSGSHGYRAWAGHLMPTVDLTSLAGGRTGDEGFLLVCAIGSLDRPGVAGFVVDRVHELRFYRTTGPLMPGMPLTVPPDDHPLAPDKGSRALYYSQQFLDTVFSLTFKANRKDPLTYFNAHWPGIATPGENGGDKQTIGANRADDIQKDVVDALTDIAEPIDFFNEVIRSPALHEDLFAWKVFDMVINAYANDRVLELIAKRVKQDRNFIRVPTPTVVSGLQELRNELWNS